MWALDAGPKTYGHLKAPRDNQPVRYDASRPGYSGGWQLDAWAAGESADGSIEGRSWEEGGSCAHIWFAAMLVIWPGRPGTAGCPEMKSTSSNAPRQRATP